MKKILSLSILVCLAMGLISWGVTGHRTIGRIAEDHLTPEAKAGVKDLLGHERLADVSTWADEIRSANPETGPWHFLNLPSGLSYYEFEKQVLTMQQANVYSALLSAERELKDPKMPYIKRRDALKFIVHFVGDIHQPMHVSHAEDKGGNTIQLSFEGAGTNLHALWDTNLLEKQGLSYDKLADKFDHATPGQIKKWQSDPPIIWAWESYQVSPILYTEIDTMQNKNLGKDYYDTHMPVVELRIEKAGIRLAGVLNSIFAK